MKLFRLQTMKSLRLLNKVLFQKNNHPIYNALCAFLSSVLLFFFFSISPYMENSYFARNRQIEANTVSVAKHFSYDESNGSTLASLNEEALAFQKEEIETLDFYSRLTSLHRSIFVRCYTKNTDHATILDALFVDKDFNVSNLVYLDSEDPYYLPDNRVLIVRGADTPNGKTASESAFLNTLSDDVDTPTLHLEPLTDMNRQTIDEASVPLLVLSDPYWESFDMDQVMVYYTLTLSSPLSQVELVRLSSASGFNVNFSTVVFDGFCHPLRNYLSQMPVVNSLVRVGYWLTLIVELAMFLFKVTSAVLYFQKNKEMYLNQRKLGYPRKNMIFEYALSQTLTFLFGYLLSFAFFFAFQGIFASAGGYWFFTQWYVSILCFIPFALTLLIELLYRCTSLEWK